MKNTLHIGSHSARVKHTFIEVCKCKYFHITKRVHKCSMCREEERKEASQ